VKTVVVYCVDISKVFEIFSINREVKRKMINERAYNIIYYSPSTQH
jgi:hypothetical protein